MNPISDDRWGKYDEEYDRRAQKLKRKQNPRKRNFVDQQLGKIEREEGAKRQSDHAKAEISKVVEKLIKNDSTNSNRLIKIYTRWVKDSLIQDYPIIDDGDLEIKTTTPSVKAGGQQRQKSHTSVRIKHIPTLMQVKNEEERNAEQNKLRAMENLHNLLTEHLLQWKQLNTNDPEKVIEELIS